MIVGITGGIATGKSTVLEIIRKNGYYVVDSDVIVSELLSQNKDVIALIDANFKKVVVNGKIDRHRLAKIVFAKEKERKKLNGLIHPLVKEAIKEKIKLNNQEHAFVDVPLLYEANFEDLFNIIICVYAPNEIALERLMNRNQLSKKDAMKRINAQMDIEEKKHRADYVIDTNVAMDKIIEQVVGVINSAVLRNI